jgi:aspartate/methionine/tyrosine aminotransferase
MAFLPPFKLERYFAAHEFSAKHLLCTSDCESVSISELLALEPGAEGELLGSRLGYTETRGAPALREAIAALYEGLPSEGVFVHAGAEEGILNLCLSLLEAGDHVVVNSPCYASLSSIPRAIGCAVSPWSLREVPGPAESPCDSAHRALPQSAESRSDSARRAPARRWALDPDELARLLQAKTKLVVINMPHNPTGALMRPEEFEATIELCRKAGAILLVDEVYRHLERDPSRRLPAVCDAYENGVSLNVLSKSAGLAGLRIGWLATRRADILDRVAAMKDYNSICASGPSEVLAGVALRHFEKIVARNRALCAANLALLEDFFSRRPDFAAWTEPEGGSIAFPRLSLASPWKNAEGRPDASLLAEALLAEAGVLILPGATYDYDPAYFRIGYGRASMPAALEALDTWLSEKMSS